MVLVLLTLVMPIRVKSATFVLELEMCTTFAKPDPVTLNNRFVCAGKSDPTRIPSAPDPAMYASSMLLLVPSR
jgi:hypothetical protein